MAVAEVEIEKFFEKGRHFRSPPRAALLLGMPLLIILWYCQTQTAILD